ncbi:MAG: hypothetical protein QOD06_2345 [Candidatus Binatota bacterium]|jgi:S-adenosylmethionine hydrolase|nr:hypothetical protein [Candidatus Binatota bacterium]
MSAPRRTVEPHRAEADPVVSLLTDFGERDGFVGVIRAVILGICPRARLVDLTHEVRPQDVVGGALVLENAVEYFPPGTVHLAVVDPGVGGARRPIVIETERFLLVGPDNGLLSLAAERSPRRRVVHLDRSSWFRESGSRTFHGRDVFAPVAGHLAAGTPAAELGSEIEEYEHVVLPVPRSIDGAVEGQVIHVDRFGNLISNLRQEDLAAFRDSELSVSIAGVRIRGIVTHYAAVREGGTLALWNSWGRLEIAVRNGSAARHLRAHPGDRVEVRRASGS